MKKYIIVSFMLAGILMMQNATAQLSININIGNQPAWGPVGYNYVRYYYLPEINVYYDVDAKMFIYPSGRKWVTARYLPRNYGHIDLYKTYKVVINRNYPPYRDNRADIAKYSRYKNIRNQVVIRDSRDRKYLESNNRTHEDRIIARNRARR